MYIDFVVPRWGRCGASDTLSNLRPADDPELARIDLRASQWCEPAGLVAIAAFAEAQMLLGRSVQLFGPADFNKANYLTRMHLDEVLGDLGCRHDLTPVRKTEGLALLELRRFEGEAGAAALAELVYEQTAARPDVAGALHKSLSEIGGNVSQHSGSPHGYMAAVKTDQGRRIEFAVADAGRGLTANLAPFGAVSDARSLEMVLEEGISSTGQRGRGNGIPDTRRLVTALGGHVHMITGDAGRTASRTWSSRSQGRLPFPGTLLQGSLLCP